MNSLMKSLSNLFFAIAVGSSLSSSGASAFSPAHHQISSRRSKDTPPSSPSTTQLDYLPGVLISEYATREVYPMEEWAAQYGYQKADGVEICPNDDEGKDYQLVARSPIPGGSAVLYVPAILVISSVGAEMEFGDSLQQAEQALVRMERGLAERLPLFRLTIKILSEFDRGQDSPYFTWLNSLPSTFYNGVAMTDACFECLPPYAAMLSMNERNTYSRFLNAIRQGYVPLNQSTIDNDQIVKWAYNVALTRFHEIWEPTRQKLIIPMVDMLNHAFEANCEINVDAEGNVSVEALWDIQPGTPLTISLGDPTNPTPLLAKHGFLSNDCPTIFCKAMHLESQIEELGYDFKDLLFQTQTGEISSKVWDVFLYGLLQSNDPGSANEFFIACKVNDEATKQQYHEYYFAYTLDTLKQHVYGILGDVDTLTAKAQSYDLRTHPRIPIIIDHNKLVRDTFTMTASLLEQMG